MVASPETCRLLPTPAFPWPIFNLDQKNPNAQTDFEHLPPEQLVSDIWQKEQRILEILDEIKLVLASKP